MKFEKVLAIVLALAVFVGLGAYALNSGITDVDTDNEDNEQTSTQATSLPQTTTPSNNNETLKYKQDLPFELKLENLAPLDGAMYEGWLIKGEDKLSFGVFNTNEFGDVIGDLTLTDEVADDGDQVVITIEPENDSDPAPSGIVILSGEFEEGELDLAFPIDVATFTGKYILGTPTDGSTANEEAGIWFMDLTNGQAAGLDVPVAPEGWIYEGWVVINGEPISTGKFVDPATADDFNGYSGPVAAPAFPGEDFLANLPNGLESPYDLDNGQVTAVISIEPYIDGADPTGDGPAQVKPLSAAIPLDLDDHETTDMVLSTDSVPSGSAVADEQF